MTFRLKDLRLYKLNVPYYTNVGVILVTQEGAFPQGCRFPLTRYTGRDSNAGLSQPFVDLVSRCFVLDNNNSSRIINQIFAYISSNFSFKDLDIVPPACPVLVFHFRLRHTHYWAPEVNIIFDVVRVLRIDEDVLNSDDVWGRLVPIAPTTTEILDSYHGQELCCLCGEGYPIFEEIVHKTKCNHIFHATCISSHLLRVPQCPVCSTGLLPVDIRTLLFN